MDASVIICTYNRASSLRLTLESLRGMSVPASLKWELIVVDNNSSDNTRGVVEEFAQASGLKVRYLFERRQGLSHARNTGIEHAAGEITAFTDDDVVVGPEWLPELVVAFREFHCAGVAGKSVPLWGGLAKPRWLATKGPYRLGDGLLLDFDLGKQSKLTRVPPWGVNMAFKKSALEKYGLFRNDLGVSGSAGMLGEDTELGKRLIGAGEKIAYSAGAVVHHPVMQHRITKSYFLSYYYRLGRTYARQNSRPPGAVLWFGYPRFIFRGLLESCLKWLVTVSPAKRFYYKAETYCYLGRIVETAKSNTAGKAAGIELSRAPARLGQRSK